MTKLEMIEMDEKVFDHLIRDVPESRHREFLLVRFGNPV